MDWGPSLTDCWGGAPGPNEGFLETMSDRGSECHVINLVTGVTEGGGGGGRHVSFSEGQRTTCLCTRKNGKFI